MDRDGGYKALSSRPCRRTANRVVEVVKRPDFAKGFALPPKRWKVEQTIGVLTISRRLKIDYETLLHVLPAAMLFSSITRLLASITMARHFPNGL
jgi:putative transposase